MVRLFILSIIIFSTTFLFSKESIKKVSIQFMWHDQFEFAGFYMAKEKGFYKDLGLKVEFKKFTPEINVTNKVISGEATFGTSSNSLIVDKANGKDIILLGSIFQSSPLILLGLKRNDLMTVKDIKNKKVMLTESQQYFTTLQSMLASNNVHLEDLLILKHTFNVDSLIKGETDLMLAYSTNEPYVLKEKGYEGKVFHPKDYGFDFYEELIFTSKEFANKNPEIVKKFYEATIKGWHYAFDNIDEVSKIVYERYNPQKKSLESLIFEAEEMKKLAYTENGQIGTITEERLKLIEYSYRLLGLLKNEIDVKEIMFSYDKKNKPLNFLEKEKIYLKNKSSISMCIDPEWMPFEKNDKGKHIGISSDYFKIIERKLKKKIIMIPTQSWSQTLEYIKNKKCDIISLAMATPHREKYLNFTKPYLKTPLVITTNLEAPFILNIKELKNKKVGITKEYAFEELLKTKYPYLDFVEVENIHEGLKLVHNGEIYAYIDALISTGYEIQKQYIGQLKITGKFDEQWELAVATRKDSPLLNSILNKVLTTITQEEKQNILNKWISVNYQKELDYKNFYKILISIFIFITILAFLYRHFLLKEANKTLHRKVVEEIGKREQQHNVIIQQTKKAAMGEMLENIAHQWRQPLSVISVAATGLKMKKEYNLLTDEEFIDSIESINKSAQFLSKTIDDFRNFYSDDKVSKEFFVDKTLEKALELFGISFNNNGIEVIKNIEEVKINSIENELIQVLINLLNNSRDALENVSNNKFIFVNCYKKEDSLIINIKDNANGIPDKIIDKIFEPYFTTKHQSQGTGIGLYMSDQIISGHLEGTIEIENKEFIYENNNYTGASFTITLPLYMSDSLSL